MNKLIGDIKDLNINKTIICSIDNNKYLFNYEPDNEELKFYEKLSINLEKYIENCKDKNFIEIGTHFGLCSIKYSKYFKNILLCSEPDSLLFNQLCGNIYINNIFENILPFNYGLSQYEGKTTMKRFYNIEEKEILTWEPIFFKH